MSNKQAVFLLLEEIGYSGSKTEVRKEYENLFIVIKPQKSRFGDEVFLNFGVVYKKLLTKKVAKLQDSHMTFRFRQLIMALKKDKYDHEEDSSFHLPQFNETFKKNYEEFLEKLVLEFDDLKKMSNNFPKNIPVLDSDEEDRTEVVYYWNHEEQLKELFKKNTTC